MLPIGSAAAMTNHCKAGAKLCKFSAVGNSAQAPVLSCRMINILVVDDDPHIREVVCFALAKNGFATCEAQDGVAALQCFEERQPALVVLDVLMPELDGVDVCRELRRHSSVPILFLSSKDEEIDRIIGLEIGGDDYVTKPFSPRELVARVKALLRRAQPGNGTGAHTASAPITVGLLRLDCEAFDARWDDKRLVLTATEFGILSTLARHPTRVFSRDALMQQAYPNHRIVSDRTIDSHIRRLRDKLRKVGANPIQTVHGVGYRLTNA
jgi:two-component system OmpR family response regulator